MEFGKHELISAYLKYVENTESPKVCHLWAVLSGVSACLGRRCWYETGIGPVWPNMYILLSGPPGGRKSSAIGYVRNLLQQSTTIRFAPDDTGGQRQGLIKAMTNLGCDDITDDDFANMLQGLKEVSDHPLQVNGQSTDALLEKLNKVQFDTRDPRTMYICASEAKSFLGENNAQMLTFLIKMWDGDYYKYELRNTDYEIKDGLLGLIGATTPTDLATMLPPTAMGSGFTSRIIFVYSPGRSKRIPRPTLDKDCERFLAAAFSALFEKFDGAFRETPKAAKFYDDIYHRGVALQDPRFLHYMERRHTHLQKTALAFAAARGSMEIDVEDLKIADELLLATEMDMPDALGEYGMNKSSAAKQKLLEFVTGSSEPIPMTALYAMMSRDMTQIEFKNTMTELHNGKKVSIFNLDGVGQCVIGVSLSEAKKAKREMAQVVNLLKM